MSSTILHKRNPTQGVVPSVSALSAGEIAINTADGKFFTKTVANEVKTFLNSDQLPFSLDQSLSSVNYQYGENGVSGVLSVVLGGVSNSVSGAGSTVVNGSDNTIDGDYAFIGNGSNNIINIEGDFGAIVGGQNNTLSHPETFILGSNISSHLSGFTYVNNLSSAGKIYGDGSQLTGIVHGDAEVTSLVRNTSANWDEAYGIATAYKAASSTFLTSETDSQTISFNESTKDLSISNGNVVSLSALVDSSIDTGVRTLTSFWESTYTSVQLNSATNWNYQGNDIKALSGNWETGYQYSTKFSQTSSTFATNSYVDSSFVKLTGAVVTGTFEISSSNASAVLYVGSDEKIGINTSNPSHNLTVVGTISSTGIVYTSNDVEITNSTKGIILRSPNNSRWRVTITDTGTLSTIAL